MPVYRGSDGKIIEKKTERRKEDTESMDKEANREPANAGRLDASPQRMGESRPPSDIGAEEKTRLVGGRRREDKKSTEADRGMDDPVVGWLVVVEGPGKGRAMQLGYGSNPLGRGATDRIKLDFGDDQISRNGHAVVTYDPRGRKFYVQHGGGTNLTYLGDQPVLAPAELPALSHIGIGNTVLRFVPLCGAEFDWQDTEGSEAQ